MVNTAAALKTPAIIVGDAPKTKLSLGDGISDEVTLSFSVQNLTDKEIIYDDVSVEMITDGFEIDNTTGNYNVVRGNSVRLSILNDTLPEEIVVPPNDNVSITAEVKLDGEELAANSEIFKNGFYIDGFVILGKSDSSIPEISMPFSGFYGDWAAESVFDKTMYDEGGSVLYKPGADSTGGTYMCTTTMTEEYFAAAGKSNDGEFNLDKIAFSPNGDGWGDDIGIIITLLRAARNVNCSLSEKDGNVIVSEDIEGVISKYITYAILLDKVRDMDETALPDGEYTFTINGAFNYDGAKTETLEFPVTVDREKPEITAVSLENDILTVTAADNQYINNILIEYDNNGETVEEIVSADSEKGGEATAEFDISDIEKDSITIKVCDYAMNTVSAKLMNALDLLIADMTDYFTRGNITSSKVLLTNTSDEDISGNVLIAFYGEDNKLAAMGSQELNIASGESQECVFDMFADTQNAVRAKLFIWSDTENIRPLDNAKYFDLLKYKSDNDV